MSADLLDAYLWAERQIPAPKEPPMSDPEMLSVAPEFSSDAEYEAWLTMIHKEIPNEGETDADYRQERED